MDTDNDFQALITSAEEYGHLQRALSKCGLARLDKGQKELAPIFMMADSLRESCHPDINLVVRETAIESAIMATLVMRNLEAELIKMGAPSQQKHDGAQRQSFKDTITSWRTAGIQYDNALKQLGMDRPKSAAGEDPAALLFKSLFDRLAIPLPNAR